MENELCGGKKKKIKLRWGETGRWNCMLLGTQSAPPNYMLQHACILSVCTYAWDVSDPLPVSKKGVLSRGSRLNFK
jgi:hypothetical protein